MAITILLGDQYHEAMEESARTPVSRRERKKHTFFFTGKTTPIRRTAVRVTGVSRHHTGRIEGTPATPRTITALSY